MDILGKSEGEDVVFSFEVAGVSARWGVREVRFHEGLSECFHGSVDVLCTDASPTAEELLGKDCHLTLERGSETRSFRGLVRNARVRAGYEDDVVVQFQVVPALWLLTQTRDSRIYQEMTVVEVVESVFAEFVEGFNRSINTSSLTETYPTHEYIVQYRESHFDFIARLMESEGIFFFFDHSGEYEELVLADTADNLEAVRPQDGGRVPFSRDPSQTPDLEAVFELHHDEYVGSTHVVVNDYDWTNPSVTILTEPSEQPEGEPRLEVYEHANAVSFHEYGGRQYEQDTASTQADLRAQLLMLERRSWGMDTTVVSAAAGKLIEVSDAPSPAFDERFLIVDLDTQGSATPGEAGSWENALSCVPLSLRYRPRRRFERPTIAGFESATVVGPANEEVYTDEHGRIKVQFHWDRQGQKDDQSSCFIRVSQAWAGAGFGAFFLPRIGMEVLVAFLGGDPDRPVVTGCVHNGMNPTPYALPDEKTKSGIKTSSSLGGDGTNELRFEDAAGSEEIYVHAQKDYNEVVENDHSTQVGANQSNTVSADQSNTVSGNQTESITGDQDITVSGARSKTVTGDETLTLQANRSTTVGSNETVTVGGNQSTTVSGASSHTTITARSENVGAAKALSIGAAYQVSVGAAMNESVGAIKSEEVGGAKIVAIGATHQVSVGASQSTSVGTSLSADAGDSITLKTGDSTLTMNKDGNIIIEGKTLTFKTNKGTFVIEDSGDIALKGKKTTVDGSKISIKGSGPVAIKGSKVTAN